LSISLSILLNKKHWNLKQNSHQFGRKNVTFLAMKWQFSLTIFHTVKAKNVDSTSTFSESWISPIFKTRRLKIMDKRDNDPLKDKLSNDKELWVTFIFNLPLFYQVESSQIDIKIVVKGPSRSEKSSFYPKT